MNETHEHLEHAEHAGHGADPFTLRVAMSMTIIAAVLATVSLIGHRKHNEALQSLGNSNRLHTEAAAMEVKSSNQFAFYQSKRARTEQAKYAIDSVALLAPAPNSEETRRKKIEEWLAYIKKNDVKEADVKLDANGLPVNDKNGEEDNSPGALIIRGKKYHLLAEQNDAEAKAQEEHYEHVHHQAGWLDWSHLMVELGLVLCTICVLTKKTEFWLAGIVAAAAGIGLAAYAFA
jgi:hypothetical protein